MRPERQDWRGVLEWKNDDVPVGTSSGAAAKLYDAAVTQFVGWYDDVQFDGLEATIDRMLREDVNFVSGRALKLGLEMVGTSATIRLNTRLRFEINELESYVASHPNIPFREKKHVEAVVKWSKGELYQAALTWEDLLIEHPTDIHALKMAQDTYFFLGKQVELRDSIARVMPFWTSRAIPLKSYLHGMYAFGLEETKFYAKAEIEARKGLARNPYDGWATHALAHVFEMEARTGEGIEFMRRTEDEWKTCNHLMVHNYWHLALYHMEKGEFEATRSIFDREIMDRATVTKSMLDIVDMTSLAFRQKLEGGRFGEDIRWDEIYDIVRPHMRDHILCFNDAHLMFACLGAGKLDEAEELINSLEKDWDNIPIAGKDYVRQLLKAILAYGRKKYREAVDLLIPIRYKLVKIGGSDAQRDVFNQLLIVCAMKSESKHHHKLAEHLLIERAAQKDHSPLTKRLTFKLRDVRDY